MLIGISGRRGTGKTTAANYLLRKHGFKRVSFADELKRLAKTLMPFTDNDLSVIAKKEAKFKTYDWSPREFMIHFGEFMRFHDPNYWLDRGMSLVTDTTQSFVFDDVRYKNEAEAVKAAGGVLLRIERYEKKNPYGKNLDTPSETDLDNYTFDYTIPAVRNTTLTELYNQVESFMSERTS